MNGEYDPDSPNNTVYDLPPGTGYVKSIQIVPDTGYGPTNTTTGWHKIVSPPRAEADPMEQVGRFAQQAYATMPAQEAEAAVVSAIQFQGLRGYNRDMQSGKTANEAIAKWGPAMFYQSPQALATVMKANQVEPAMTPYQQANLDLARRRLELATQEKDVAPTAFDRDPNKAYITRGGAYIPPVKPAATEVQTVTETIPAQEAVPAVPAKAPTTLFGVTLSKGTEAQPAIPGHGEMRIKRTIPAGQSLSEAAAVSAPEQKSGKEVVRQTKDGKKAVFDAVTKKFLRYAE